MNPLQYVVILGGSMLTSYIFASLSPENARRQHGLPPNVEKATTKQLCHWYSMQREWKKPFDSKSTKSSSKSGQSKNSNIITLMSYNILADGRYAMHHSSDCDPKYLGWDYRWKLIESQIMAYKPDIVVMQEPTRDMFKNFLNKEMKTKFNMVGFHAPKQYPAKCEIKQSDALFIDENKYDIIDTSIVNFNDILATIENTKYYVSNGTPIIFANANENENGNKKDRLPYDTKFWQLLKFRKDSVIIALLKCKGSENDKCFAVCGSHLFFNPKHPDIKAAQAYLINNIIQIELQKMLDKEKNGIKNIKNVNDIPIVLGIDANAMPFVTVDNNEMDKNFMPWINNESVLNKIESIDGINNGDYMLPVKDSYNGESLSGVYQLFTQGKLEAKHCDHVIGRFNIRSMFDEISNNRKNDNSEAKNENEENKEKKDKKDEYKEVMGPWALFGDFDKFSEFEGLKGFNYDWKVPMTWDSVYRHLNQDGKEPKYTTRTGPFKGCIDYIFINENFQIESILDWENDGNLNDDTVYPNKLAPSDHLPLVTKLRLI